MVHANLVGLAVLNDQVVDFYVFYDVVFTAIVEVFDVIFDGEPIEAELVLDC